MWWDEASTQVLPFRDRAEAGRLLGASLCAYREQSNVLVLALPRGGVPVGYEIAEALQVPLDVFVVRKLGVPGNPELAMGAVAPAGVCILHQETIAAFDLPGETVATIAQREEQERRCQEDLYRRDLPQLSIAGKTIILVDDGVATGATMRAAVAALRQLNAERIVVAVPVAPPSTCQELRAIADELVCLESPEIFFTVGQWYVNFEQVSDEMLLALLKQASIAIRSESCHCRS